MKSHPDVLLDDDALHCGSLRLLSCLLLLQIPGVIVGLALFLVSCIVGVLVRQASLSMT